MQATSIALIKQHSYRRSYAGTIHVSVPELEFRRKFTFTSSRPFEAAGCLCVNSCGRRIFEVYGDLTKPQGDGYCVSLPEDVALYAPAIFIPTVIGIQAAEETYVRMFTDGAADKVPAWQRAARGDLLLIRITCWCELTNWQCIGYTYGCTLDWMRHQQPQVSRPSRMVAVG